MAVTVACHQMAVRFLFLLPGRMDFLTVCVEVLGAYPLGAPWQGTEQGCCFGHMQGPTGGYSVLCWPIVLILACVRFSVGF